MLEWGHNVLIPREYSSNCVLCPPPLSTGACRWGTYKVHKKDVRVRPIVSGMNSVMYGLAKHLVKLPNPLVGKSKYIKNSEHLVKLLKEINLEEDDVFVSYGVTALFTSVLCDEVVDIAVDRAKKDPECYNRTKLTLEEMGELLTFCLNTTYFKYQGEFYQQVFSAAMGSPISLIIANMFMEMFKIKALAT